MAGFSTTLRTNRSNAILSLLGSAAKLRIYAGTKPATGGAETSVLATLTCASPFGLVAAGVLTASTIPPLAASATGTANWARLMTSTNTPVIDLTVTQTGLGGEVQLTSTAIVSGGTVTINSLIITEGNV